VRREPVRPPCGQPQSGHPHRDEKPQLLQGHCPGHRVRIPAADRAAGTGQAGGAGDPALGREQGRHLCHALQGECPGLPLLP
jgi:hypothetical protein